jgi:hypothetical protein
MMSCFLISNRKESWLCHTLIPPERMAKLPHERIAKILHKLPPRPGAQFPYMESCDVDCDLVHGQVFEIHHLYRSEW